jgi:tRNA threonylcarbamoyl adenosine modification protein YjeE
MASAPLTVELADPEATVRFAEDVSLALQQGDCLCLSGDLGAGKSTFARALIRAIADDPDLEAPSPTFTLVQSYELRLPVAHMDLYRLGSPDELDELGLDDALGEGVALIEWPEKALELLPEDRVMIRFDGIGDSRTLAISGPAAFTARLERSRAARAFLEANLGTRVIRRHLQGDASSRTYETIRPQDGDPVILMNAPRKPDGPPVRDGFPIHRSPIWRKTSCRSSPLPDVRSMGVCRARNPCGRISTRAFCWLRTSAPKAFSMRTASLIRNAIRVPIDCLAALHARDLPGQQLPAGGKLHHVPAYDARAMQIEVELLTDWYLPWRRGASGSRSGAAGLS